MEERADFEMELAAMLIPSSSASSGPCPPNLRPTGDHNMVQAGIALAILAVMSVEVSENLPSS